MEKLYVIKIGGNVIDDEQRLTGFLQTVSQLRGKKILVHGGGKIASAIGEKLGIKPNYVNGRRITDAETIDLVTMVYGGLVNKKIVAGLQAMGTDAIGLTGADGNLIPAVKRPVKDIDYGFVGDVQPAELDPALLVLLLEKGVMPVFAPLTHDGMGQVLNTNADTIASALAVCLSRRYAVRLIYCFEKKGVLADISNEQSLVPLIDRVLYEQLKAEHKLADGILPKIDNAFEAINNGVQEVVIGDARDLLCNASGPVSGTLIK